MWVECCGRLVLVRVLRVLSQTARSRARFEIGVVVINVASMKGPFSFARHGFLDYAPRLLKEFMYSAAVLVAIQRFLEIKDTHRP